MTQTETAKTANKFSHGDRVGWTTIVDDDGTLKPCVRNGIIDCYHGMISGEPNWIIIRNGESHYVPEREIFRL